MSKFLGIKYSIYIFTHNKYLCDDLRRKIYYDAHEVENLKCLYCNNIIIYQKLNLLDIVNSEHFLNTNFNVICHECLLHMD